MVFSGSEAGKVGAFRSDRMLQGLDEGTGGLIVEVTGQEKGLACAFGQFLDEAEGGHSVGLGKREVGAAKHIFLELGHQHHPRLLASRKGMGGCFSGFLAREDANAVFSSSTTVSTVYLFLSMILLLSV